MKCEFVYCIYNEDSLCVLEEIRINALGMCEECIMVTIAEEKLKIMKERDLESLRYLQ